MASIQMPAGQVTRRQIRRLRKKVSFFGAGLWFFIFGLSPLCVGFVVVGGVYLNERWDLASMVPIGIVFMVIGAPLVVFGLLSMRLEPKYLNRLQELCS